MLNGLRLTLESGVPVSTSDQTGKTTLYLTPYISGYIALYVSSAWVAKSTAQVSLALGTLVSGKNYDVFANWTGSAVALSFGTAWTDDTTRAEALATQDGIYVKTGDATKRYVGTIRTTSTTATEDSAAKRFVYNGPEPWRQVDRPLFVADGTDTWNYSSTTVRQANGATGNKVEFVVGLTTQIEATVRAAGTLFTSSPIAGIGIDSITAFVAGQTRTSTVDNAAPGGSLTADYKGALAAGYHYAAWLECASAASRADFYGDNGGAFIVSGLTAQVPG